ncbi:MAG: hypothetical protein WBF93_00610 [Pirellulales bacterium]|nr:hypothetical protein [Pirellulales bacterium]
MPTDRSTTDSSGSDFTDPTQQRETLGDGYRVAARIVVAAAEDVVKVPSGVLFRVETTGASSACLMVVPARKVSARESPTDLRPRLSRACLQGTY